MYELYSRSLQKLKKNYPIILLKPQKQPVLDPVLIYWQERQLEIIEKMEYQGGSEMAYATYLR